MYRISEEPYRELRAVFQHLLETAQAVRDQFAAHDGRFEALDEALRQAQEYQQSNCERCGAPFQRAALHAEFYAVAGYARVCPRCNRELGGAPNLEDDHDAPAS